MRSAVRTGRRDRSASARQARSPSESPKAFVLARKRTRPLRKILVKGHDLQPVARKGRADQRKARPALHELGDDFREVYRAHDRVAQMRRLRGRLPVRRSNERE